MNLRKKMPMNSPELPASRPNREGMTNKWKWAGERIAQIISEMIRNTERSLEGLAREMKSIGTRMGNNLANGISNATSGITRTLNNVVGKVNSTIGPV